MLRDIIYEDDYRSGEHNILNEVFRASLRVSTIYWRAVGYFSSSALEALGAPLSEFIRNGGSIRLITSVELMPQDIIAIEKGLSRRDVCAQRIEQTIEEQFFGAIGDGVSALAALLEIGRLEIRIAEPKHGYGIYHEKVGIFFDGHDYVAFSGSTNESANAFKQNYECIDIFSSWESPRRALRKLKHFEALWENEDPGATTYPFPDAAKAKLIRVCAREPGSTENAISDTKKLVPWAHQNDALVEFIKRERGVLNMATGTGKTRVAMNIMEALDVKGLLESIVVVVDGNDLLDQWYRQVLKFALSVPNKFSVFRHFGPYKE
ncbi:MAG: DEAD/DEAH box helicase family protein, partial [Burkholderiales bacterium]|nr:DEAD/DEAH box helicase family protein [Burkholderiales bacterium]